MWLEGLYEGGANRAKLFGLITIFDSQFILLFVGIVLIVWLGTFYLISSQQKSEHEHHNTQVINASILFEQHTLRILRHADTYIKAVRREYLKYGTIESVDDFMAEAPLDKDVISHITIMDNNGFSIPISGKKIKPGVHGRDREYFKFQKKTE